MEASRWGSVVFSKKSLVKRGIRSNRVSRPLPPTRFNNPSTFREKNPSSLSLYSWHRAQIRGGEKNRRGFLYRSVGPFFVALREIFEILLKRVRAFRATDERKFLASFERRGEGRGESKRNDEMRPVSRVAKITGREVLRLTNSVVRRYLSETFAVSNVSLFVLSLSLSLEQKFRKRVERESSLVTEKKKKRRSRGMKIGSNARSRISHGSQRFTLLARFPHIPSPRREVGREKTWWKRGNAVRTSGWRVKFRP